jgi:succinate dehydrogenase / fumarate reductase cytochrome b subunit
MKRFFDIVLPAALRYRGKGGQVSFLLHRISGLGVLVFLTIHILDTATVYFIPELYQEAINLYRNPFFQVGEIILVFMVFFHGVNGLRLIIFDLAPAYWEARYVPRSQFWVFVISLLLWLPAAFIMGRNLLVYTILGG